MTSTANRKESVTPVPSGTTSSVSSDLSGTSGHEEDEVAHAWVAAAIQNARNSANDNDRWYYYLSPDAAKRLPHYQYQGADLSLLYKHVLSPVAAWCVDNLTPTWLAPNAITLLGLAWMILSYGVIWYWCPGMYEANTDILDATSGGNAVPGAIFLLNGCAMLIYQTLDNMDGKQARKTGSSSPLGLLFDHGCDALNSLLGSANWIAAMAMVPGDVGDLLGNDDHGNIQAKSLLSSLLGGDAVIAALLIICPMITFYITTWEQYYTGKLILPPFNGPSEGLFMGASLSIISFLWGPMYWQSTTLTDGAIAYLGFDSLEGRVRNMDLVVLASLVGLAQEVALKTFFVVRTHGLQTIETMVPNLLLVAFTFVIVHFEPTIFLRSPRWMMHLISGLFTEQTAQLMLDHMVEEKSKLRDRWCLFLPVLLALMMMMGISFTEDHMNSMLLVYTSVLWIYLTFKIIVQLNEICDVLGIWCFDIVTPRPKEVSKADETTKKMN